MGKAAACVRKRDLDSNSEGSERERDGKVWGLTAFCLDLSLRIFGLFTMPPGLCITALPFFFFSKSSPSTMSFMSYKE